MRKFDYLAATRNLDGSIDLSVEFTDLGGLYNAYVIRRKEVEFPYSETDGYGIDSGAVAGGLDFDLNDDTGIVDGVVYYYTLFLRQVSDSTYVVGGEAYCMGLVPEFASISNDLIPEAFKGEVLGTKAGSVQFFKECLLDPVFGEVEGLIRNMPVDIDTCDPHRMSFLIRMLNWSPSPIMRLGAFRTQVKALPDRFRNKGQYGVSMLTLEEVSGVNCGLHTFNNNILVSNSIDTHKILEKTIIGVGDGIIDTFAHSVAGAIARGSVYVTANGVTLLDDCAGNLTEEVSGDPAGTVDYDLGTVSAVFPVGSIPPLGEPIWIDLDFWYGVVDLADSELQTRIGYVGDRMMYVLSQDPTTPQTGSRANVYLYVCLEIGEEGVDCFDESYDKLIVDDVLRKMWVAWPHALDTQWFIMDRIVFTGIHAIAAAHLPLEEDIGVMGVESGR